MPTTRTDMITIGGDLIVDRIRYGLRGTRLR
jgi:hypothetical protein